MGKGEIREIGRTIVIPVLDDKDIVDLDELSEHIVRLQAGRQLLAIENTRSRMPLHREGMASH